MCELYFFFSWISIEYQFFSIAKWLEIHLSGWIALKKSPDDHSSGSIFLQGAMLLLIPNIINSHKAYFNAGLGKHSNMWVISKITPLKWFMRDRILRSSQYWAQKEQTYVTAAKLIWHHCQRATNSCKQKLNLPDSSDLLFFSLSSLWEFIN